MKIALIGSAPSSVRLAPYGDPAWQIWACSPGTYSIMSRCDEFFEMHKWEPGVIGRADTQVPWFSPEYVMWMRQQKVLWMVDPLPPEMPNAKAVPWQELVAKYGSYFFTSSLSWMMAMAIERILEAGKPEDSMIGMWGVDMAANEEYCVAPETKVLTADLRWVPASELQEGDQIIAFDEDAGGKTGSFREWKQATVLSAHRIKRPCKRLLMEDGTQLVSSDEHRWLTYAEHENRWKETKDMVTAHHRSDRPTRIVKLTNTWTEDRSWEAGYLAAAFDGEGNLLQKTRNNCDGVQLGLGFAQRENAMSDAVIAAAEAKGFKLSTTGIGGKNNDCAKYRLAGTRSDVLEFLGRIRPRRLMAKFKPDMLGKMHRKDAVAVVSMEDIGEQEVIALKTSTGTFVAEGFASHNSDQRPGCQFFVQVATQLGIKVFIPPESDLMAPPVLYGVCEHSHIFVKLRARRKELESRLANAQASAGAIATQIAHLQGALDDLEYMWKTWSQRGEMMSMDFKRLFGHDVAQDTTDGGLLYGGGPGGGMGEASLNTTSLSTGIGNPTQIVKRKRRRKS